MGRTKTFKKTASEWLTRVAIATFYLMPLAMALRWHYTFLVLFCVMGLCYWIVAYIALFKEPYKSGRAFPNRNDDGTYRYHDGHAISKKAEKKISDYSKKG
ncbi:MAG: hypothetical protein AAGB31_12305 [Bdellovibrio sp.]